MFYTILTTRVMFMAKTKLDVSSLRREHVWVVLGDRIHYCEMKRVTESGRQGIKTRDHFCCTLTLGEPNTNRESNPKDNLLSAGSPKCHLLRSAGFPMTLQCFPP